MKLRHDNFSCRNAFFSVHAGRDAAPVIFDRNRPVGIQCNDDFVAMARQRFVDRIVTNFEHHMVKAGTVIGVADVHAGTLADRIQPLENFDRICIIGVGVGSVVGNGIFGRCVRRVCHEKSIRARRQEPK